MKALCNIVLILAAAAAIAPAAHGQYATPVTVTYLTCNDSNGNPCGNWIFANGFYDVYASTSGTICSDSSTPPQVTYPNATATVYNTGGCGPESASTSMSSVSNINNSGIDAVDDQASLTLYTTTVSAEIE